MVIVLVAVVVLVVVGLVAWLAVYAYRQNEAQENELVAGFAGDPEYEAQRGGATTWSQVRTRSAPLPAVLEPATRSHRDPGAERAERTQFAWVVRVSGVGLGARTTLWVARRIHGGVGDVVDALGLGAVDTGDAAFDHALRVSGSDDDALRAAFAAPRARDAASALFAMPVQRCSLDRDGTLTVEITRRGMDPAEARRVLDAARALAAALHGA
jgi:hypothetical protein